MLRTWRGDLCGRLIRAVFVLGLVACGGEPLGLPELSDAGAHVDSGNPRPGHLEPGAAAVAEAPPALLAPPLPDGTDAGTVFGVDVPADPPPFVPALPSFEDGLPTLYLSLAADINGDEYTDATVFADGHTYRAEAKFRGATSREFPKKSYTLKFDRDDLFGDRRPAAPFVGKRKVVLYASFDDNSYLRTALAFSLWNRLQGGALQVQTYHAVIYLDGVYHGLYTVLDFIDEDFFAAQGLGDEGQLFKAVEHANFYATDPSSTLYEKKAGFPEAGASEDDTAFAPIDALRGFVRDADTRNFAAQAGQWLDLKSYGSWFMLVSALQADDTFGKNTYQYLPHETDSWRVVPWDFNHSFGQTYLTGREPHTAPAASQATNNLLFMRIYDDPYLGPRLRDRYRDALLGDIEVTALIADVQALAASIRSAALRDQDRWGDVYRHYPRWSWRTDFTTHDQEIAYVIEWIVQRWAYLRAELGGVLLEPGSSAALSP